MSVRASGVLSSHQNAISSSRAAAHLFFISLFLLFLELACIRWFPAHVLFLTFFTNTILLACFLGMSVGCLAANQERSLLVYSPGFLAVTMAVAHEFDHRRSSLRQVLRLGDPASPQYVFFGTEHVMPDVSDFFIPIETVEGFFFLMIALALMGPGQELGRALNRWPNRVQAYTLNVLGSIAGIVLFALCARWELAPFWWFLLIAMGFGHLLLSGRLVDRAARRLGALACLAAILFISSLTSGSYKVAGAWRGAHIWSPYYRIDYDYVGGKSISVNLIGHQQMVSRNDNFSPAYAYALPHLLERDIGGPPFGDVLIIGAGSGNDVSRALEWGARHVDAVEIDPVIMRLGAEDHPDRPYEDARVTTHFDDGRNFLRSSHGQYDLIIYALVDSLVLHSSYSDIRLESYLFTQEAFRDVRSHLKPGGLFVMYNYFRQGWIVGRIYESLKENFGAEPLVLTFPYRGIIRPETGGGFTMFASGATERLRTRFQVQPDYWLRSNQAPSPGSPNGFEQHPLPADLSKWMRFGLATIIYQVNLGIASDNWPFLYLRRPMIPLLSLRGMAIMGGLALVLIYLFHPELFATGKLSASRGLMFFLGAGFMLVETKAVVHMALLFGSTWMVNSAVFIAVLVMILAANVLVLKVKPDKLGPYYAGLFGTLALNILIPLDFFLGMNRSLQVVSSCLLVFAPIFFAGVVFAVSFGRSAEPDRGFGTNIAGAMFGGLTEYSSMLLGFQYLMLVAMVYYGLSALLYRRGYRKISA